MTEKVQRNHALWLGPVVAAVGLVSYYTVFNWWPATRDFPWVNLLLLAGGVGLSVAGLRRAWPRGGWRRPAAALGLGLSSLLAATLVWYCFSYSYRLPPASAALDVGDAVPRLALPDPEGRPVEIAAADGVRTLLVFYRGYW